MTTRVAINGFGRIGRCTVRHIVESARNDIEVIRINATGPMRGIMSYETEPKVSVDYNHDTDFDLAQMRADKAA